MIALWRRLPAAAFGLSWVALALAPVSNVLLPTGVLLAERTLFLPSAGLVLAVGALAAAVTTEAPASVTAQRLRWAGGLAVTVILVLGTVRSATRQVVWRNNETLFADMSRHGDSYRGLELYAEDLTKQGRVPEAEATLRRAISMYSGDPKLDEELGQALRQQHRCAEAIPFLEHGLALDPDRAVARSRLFLCLRELGDTAAARVVGEAGLARGITEFRKLLGTLGK